MELHQKADHFIMVCLLCNKEPAFFKQAVKFFWFKAAVTVDDNVKALHLAQSLL